MARLAPDVQVTDSGPDRQWSVVEHRLVDIAEMLANVQHAIVQTHSKTTVPPPKRATRPRFGRAVARRLSANQLDRLKPGRRHGN